MVVGYQVAKCSVYFNLWRKKDGLTLYHPVSFLPLTFSRLAAIAG
jgi:hypothetical protein